MSETLLRQWEMLRAIPRAPSKVTVATLLEKLAAAGFKTTKRTIQRELNQLSAVFPLKSDDRSIPYGWSWAANAPAFDLPALDATTALSLRMIEQFLPTLMPPMVWETLEPQFRRAQRLLEHYGPEGLDRWTSSVRVVPREMPLVPPRVNHEAARVVYQGLLEARRVALSYAPRVLQGEVENLYTVNLLGLVVRGSVVYIICTSMERVKVFQLALHRVQRATLTDTPSIRPPEFDLDKYIATDVFLYPVGGNIRLRALFDRKAAYPLYETPLSQDQVIEEVDATTVLVTATVKDSEQLEWWLLGYSSLVEVLSPPDLRARLGTALSAGAARYARPDTASR